jgi:hypothetical protein
LGIDHGTPSAPARRNGSNVGEARALATALELSRFPRLAGTLAERPVPADIEEVLEVAASWEACTAAATDLGVTPDTLQLATRLYLKQVLLHDDADCYRILGVGPLTPRADSRRHLSWLLRWLHPDHNSGWEAAYAARVVNAWREISRGAAPGEPTRARREESRDKRRAPVFRLPRRAKPVRRKLWPRTRSIRLLLLAAGLGCIALASAAVIVR